MASTAGSVGFVEPAVPAAAEDEEETALAGELRMVDKETEGDDFLTKGKRRRNIVPISLLFFVVDKGTLIEILLWVVLVV